ncbi:N-acetyl-gamma-glutamyl-phosphate reductase [Dysgonomonas sp. PH5-45]|uniref:N-acetyl-gamma-glutamyl-phosphate reductase n=1 Tax=unclassified Dysgonomonas TaxID=2630389 RepID=UPI0024737F7A|nr:MULTISPECIES: N-acetyl-gamma-glutamyl-phosphate reductase [unclassified Dysgonomonas]MDH6355261.1 N-acetyl-gamma-glutamyl-phosphate reductase [Dysgonomonas sp. PH5-45]MDH6388117.1 N-acetyl-gamma-glutamyl-phosphate reductase [Dysgonomonas sp. PH5-37]
MNRIKAGIVGGAGYTAGELIRILLNHPYAELHFVNSVSNAGNKLYDVHNDLFGETDMVFTDSLPLDEVDVLFFCTPYGDTEKFLAGNVIPNSLKLIDLSNDYRLNAPDNDFVYGLPELYKEQIQTAHRVANPGCYATAIQLALLPLAKARLLNAEVHITGIIGTTGAGVKPTFSSHYSWRNNNVSVYKAFSHQHLGEVRQTIASLQSDFKEDINFIPIRGNFTRGIFVTAYTHFDGTEQDAIRMYEDFYRDAPFVFVIKKNPHLKQVINTNKCILCIEKHGTKLLIQSFIDNLLKGASGQAIQNMNLMFGFDQAAGLKMKASVF